jgi:hypothetical protein
MPFPPTRFLRASDGEKSDNPDRWSPRCEIVRFLDYSGTTSYKLQTCSGRNGRHHATPMGGYGARVYDTQYLQVCKKTTITSALRDGSQ